MIALPPRNRIRNFGQEMDSPRLFRHEGIALQALLANPILYAMASGQANLPEMGHLGTLSGSQVAGVGWVGSQSLEMRIGASLQSLFKYYQWHKGLSRGVDLELGQLPTMSILAADIDSRKRGTLDDSIAELREMDDDGRPVGAEEMTKETYKALLLEVGNLHLLLHSQGAQDAVSEIRLRHSRKLGEIDSPLLRKFLVQEPVSNDELLEVQKRVDSIYTDLQKSLCVAIPDDAMHDAMEHPFSSPLVKSSLEQIRQLYFHMYRNEAQGQSFMDKFLGSNFNPDGKLR